MTEDEYDELALDLEYDRMQAYWASPEGIEVQRREFEASYRSVGEPIPSCQRVGRVLICRSVPSVGGGT